MWMRAKITFSLKILHKNTVQHNGYLSGLLVRDDTSLSTWGEGKG